VRDFSTYIPTAKATRIEASEAPVIDGDVSDAVWAKAEVIDEFYQTEPDTGQPASERTELRILYDAENLYIAVYAYDRNPDLIRATTKNRDGSAIILLAILAMLFVVLAPQRATPEGSSS